MATEIIPYKDIAAMASAVVKSKFLGGNDSEVLTLMLVAQAQGRHPASVAMDYNIVYGKPALKADVILGRYQQSGGCVKWLEMTDERVVGEFTHPQSGTIKIDWDIDRAKMAELAHKDTWKKYPRALLRARVISEGVRASYPAVLGGMYSTEEVSDFDHPKSSSTTITVLPEETQSEPVKEQIQDSESLKKIIEEIKSATDRKTLRDIATRAKAAGLSEIELQKSIDEYKKRAEELGLNKKQEEHK